MLFDKRLEVKMDRKISIRLREEEYDKIAECAKKDNKSVSKYIRNKALMESDQAGLVVTNEMKIQLLKIKKQISKFSESCPNLNFKPIDDAMEVLWDELY